MIDQTLKAISAYVEALKLSRQLRLWPYYLTPALISLLLGLGIAWGAWSLGGNAASWIITHYPWSWGAGLVGKIAAIFSGLLVAALGFILYKNLVMILAGPFMSPLSEKVERHLTGQSSSEGWNMARLIRDLIRGLRIALRNIIRELLLTLALLLLGLIPILSPFIGVAVFLVQSYFAGFGNMDYTLERHFNYRNSIRFVKAHKGIALGNGIVFMLLLLTGVGVLIAPPWATVAATINTVKNLK